MSVTEARLGSTHQAARQKTSHSNAFPQIVLCSRVYCYGPQYHGGADLRPLGERFGRAVLADEGPAARENLPREVNNGAANPIVAGKVLARSSFVDENLKGSGHI